MIHPLINIYTDTAHNPTFREIAENSLVNISIDKPKLGANIAKGIATQPEFGLEGANSFFLTLRDNDWQAFSRTFGELCELDVSLAADLFNGEFGIIEEDEKIFTMHISLPKGGMASIQLSSLLSAKDEGGEYLVTTEKTVDFFNGWTKQLGGQNPWDEAIIPFVNSGRGEELLEPLMDGYNSNIYNEPMQNQFFLSLIDVTQNADNPKAIGLLNECFKEEIFELDPEVDLTESQTEDEWKKIALSSDSEWTRAAALSQIGDENWLKTYVFDIDKDGRLVFDRQVSDIEFAAIIRTGKTSTWYGQLTDKEERKYYIRKVLVADTTDLKPFIPSNFLGDELSFVCQDFASQLSMNSLGFTDKFVGEPEDWEHASYNIPQKPYGLPTFFVTVNCVNEECPEIWHSAIWPVTHAINAIFIGDNINEPWQNTNWDNWIFIEPQTDTVIIPGKYWSIPLNAIVKIQYENGYFFTFGVIYYQWIDFHINEDGSVNQGTIEDYHDLLY